MEKSLRQRFKEFRDRIGMPINKVSDHIGVELNKMYNFSGGSSLKNDDAIALHEFLKDWENHVKPDETDYDHLKEEEK